MLREWNVVNSLAQHRIASTTIVIIIIIVIKRARRSQYTVTTDVVAPFAAVYNMVSADTNTILMRVARHRQRHHQQKWNERMFRDPCTEDNFNWIDASHSEDTTNKDNDVDDRTNSIDWELWEWGGGDDGNDTEIRYSNATPLRLADCVCICLFLSRAACEINARMEIYGQSDHLIEFMRFNCIEFPHSTQT